MRSLGTIRARVERLASVCLPSPETLFLHWVDRLSGARPAPAIWRPPRRRWPWRRPSPLVRLARRPRLWCSIRPTI